LIKKYQKIKTKKSFTPQASCAPRFFVGPTHFANLNVNRNFLLGPAFSNNDFIFVIGSLNLYKMYKSG
ncbi:MAG: hypothetical protein WDZ72_14800, partial [Cyclobacteriaceae bacterium]